MQYREITALSAQTLSHHEHSATSLSAAARPTGSSRADASNPSRAPFDQSRESPDPAEACDRGGPRGGNHPSPPPSTDRWRHAIRARASDRPSGGSNHPPDSASTAVRARSSLRPAEAEHPRHACRASETYRPTDRRNANGHRSSEPPGSR